jgi:hypothetical protein
MPRLPKSTIGNAYTSDFCWSLLSDLTAVGSRMGANAANSVAPKSCGMPSKLLGYATHESPSSKSQDGGVAVPV